MSFPRYPSYKDSGIEWLGQIPEHWALERLKRKCLVFPSNVDKKTHDGEAKVLLCNYINVYYNDEISLELDLMEATATVDQIQKFSLRKNDVIITKDSETADDIAISAYVPVNLPDVVCGYHLTMIRPHENVCGLFVKRLFDSNYVKSMMAVLANGLTRVGLGQYSIDNVSLPFPPFPEQTQIAAFLDRETAKIDALVVEQQNLLALLREKRQAVISHAVTKGLNPNAPLKPSGIEWLGDVPSHWGVRCLKRVADIQTGLAKGKENGLRKTIKVPYLRVANVQNGYLDLNDVATIDLPPNDVARYLLKYGDVLMNEGGDFDKLGRGCVWRGEIMPCIAQNHVFAVRPRFINTEYLNETTNSDYAQFYFMTRSKQSTNLASISSRNLMELPILLPPENEQELIVKHIQSRTKDIDTLSAEAQRAIDLLQERRSALISAAVTGQIDVRQQLEEAAS